MSLADYARVYKAINAIYDSVYIDPKPGTYICRCAKGEYKNLVKDGKDIDKFIWILEIIEGELTGQRFQKTEFLPPDPDKAEIQIGYIKGSLERCGVHPPASVLDLPIAMSKCVGAEIKVSVTDSGAKTREGKCIKNIKFVKNLAVQATDEIVQKGSPDDLSRFDAPDFVTPSEIQQQNEELQF